MLLHYGNCKKELHELTQLKIDNLKRINQLDIHITDLLNQIQELKAVHHYQTFELEKQITILKSELGSRQCVVDTCAILSKKNEELNSQLVSNSFLKRGLEEENRSLRDEIERLRKEYADNDPVAHVVKSKKKGKSNNFELKKSGVTKIVDCIQHDS